MYFLTRGLQLIAPFLVAAASVAAQPSQQMPSKTPAAIVKESESGLALILSADGDSINLGSGFFIQDGTAVVTNFHVIQGAKRVLVKTGNGKFLDADAVYAFDEKKDLAILKVISSDVRAVKLGDSDKVAIGSSIVVIGNPEGFEKSVTNGLISGLRTVEEQKLFQISAPISHGSSGGPVFDDKGEVIGVVVAFLKDGQNLNFAIPINSVSAMWANRKETSLSGLPRSIDPPSTTAAAPTALEGSWAATFADSLSAGQLSFILIQDGASIRGTYTSSMGGGGTITGTVTNNKFSFELLQNIKDCAGKFMGSADSRSNSMAGTYSGTDCQGLHSNGSFSMTKGVVPMQPPPSAPAAASAPQPIIQYGSPSELKGVKKVFIYGAEPDVRNNMLKQFSKHGELQVVGDMATADIVLIFGASTFSMGTYTNVWTDSYGNAHGTTVPRYGITGEGSAVKFVPPNILRVLWQFSATRTSAFQRRPSTNFVRDFVNAWEKANK